MCVCVCVAVFGASKFGVVLPQHLLAALIVRWSALPLSRIVSVLLLFLVEHKNWVTAREWKWKQSQDEARAQATEPYSWEYGQQNGRKPDQLSR